MKQFLLVVTNGRSGSTLLNGILNSIDGYRIIGENSDAYRHMMNYYKSMINALNGNQTCETNFNIHREQNPWWNEFNIQQLRDNIRQIMQDTIDPSNTAKVIGFKEIRYHAHGDNLSEYLDWLYMITKCKFIWLTRNLDDVVKSEWFANNPKSNKQKLSKFESRVKQHIRVHPKQQWYHLDYGDMTQGRLKGLFTFLGATYNHDAIKEILATPHGYKITGKVKTSVIE